MRLVRGFAAVLLSLCSPIFLGSTALALAIADLAFLLFGKLSKPHPPALPLGAASVVIPNWNGRDLLEKFLPSVVLALGADTAHEIIVVDNASTDGSVGFLREQFPQVRVLALKKNLGFGGGSNAGFRTARNDIVVLLNNDMRVEPDFLTWLLRPFSDPLVFSVGCQIFFSDPAKRREETGLTETWWQAGRLRLRHRIDPLVDRVFPCGYSGGGSSAFDRQKFLELGGFDELFAPFYFEDTDLGALAWKRGWKVLYEPRSVVFHEHRGTIGRRFSRSYIDSVVKKNLLLYTWKNIHDWRLLAGHFVECTAGALCSPLARSTEARALAIGVARAFLQVRQAIQSRWRAKRLAALSDKEAFLRQKGGYYRDRFELAASGSAKEERLQLAFLSPYPIEPPSHGGAVFMKQTLAALRPLADVHLVSFLDNSMQAAEQEPLSELCASVSFVVRKHFTPYDPSDPRPRVVREFADSDFEWILQRTLYLRKVDVLQIEYTIMAQYSGAYKHIPCFLFEHDISFQSMGRRIASGTLRPGALLAYMQLLRYELRALRRVDRVQVCSRENEQYLLTYVPELEGRIDSNLRAVIDSQQYPFIENGREPDTLLFAGSFSHLPNVQGLRWFIEQVFPDIAARNPRARLIVAGSGNAKRLGACLTHPAIELKGFVPDILELLHRYSVLICPVLSGSGVRVKLLEAFASGIPVISTYLGAEGLGQTSGDLCEMEDDPKRFAAATVRLLSDPEACAEMAARARRFVETERDAQSSTVKLEGTYRAEIARCRAGILK
jgi:GT2 family glycosyltransferase/glycosyltransferase involved in cell wall biosynthesis